MNLDGLLQALAGGGEDDGYDPARLGTHVTARVPMDAFDDMERVALTIVTALAARDVFSTTLEPLADVYAEAAKAMLDKDMGGVFAGITRVMAMKREMHQGDDDEELSVPDWSESLSNEMRVVYALSEFLRAGVHRGSRPPGISDVVGGE